jgi:molybdenum cofactor biosynthesis protein B
MSETSKLHREGAAKSKGILIVTCSSSRAALANAGEKFSDPSGELIEKMMKENGHHVYERKLIPDDSEIIKTTLTDALQKDVIDTIIVTGGTGISEKDVTIEVAQKLFEKELPGFGEIFRKISFDEIGSAAILTRAKAGIVSNKPIFCIPGSPDAVKRSLDKLVIPELPHILKHAQG